MPDFLEPLGHPQALALLSVQVHAPPLLGIRTVLLCPQTLPALGTGFHLPMGLAVAVNCVHPCVSPWHGEWGSKCPPAKGSGRWRNSCFQRPPDPAGSPKGWDLPGDITDCRPMHMSHLPTFTPVPLSHVPHGVGAIAPVLLLGRLRPGPGSVPLVLTHREHTASVETAPGTGALASASGRWCSICPLLAVNIYHPHCSPGLNRRWGAREADAGMRGLDPCP